MTLAIILSVCSITLSVASLIVLWRSERRLANAELSIRLAMATIDRATRKAPPP